MLLNGNRCLLALATWAGYKKPSIVISVTLTKEMDKRIILFISYNLYSVVKAFSTVLKEG